MAVYKIENVSFAYPNENDKALDNISVSINQGEFITLCGKSGCGKTTLLRLLKTILSPVGNLEGNIFFGDSLLSDIDTRVQASRIGFVMQSPDNQIVTDKVWHELAFGLESLGYSTYDIRARVAEMASFFGIQGWFYKKTDELSGGQKQILNLASVMAMQPSVLILDEPTSQLDPIAAQEFLKILEKINRELGVTVILSEHRLDDVFSVSDRVIVMDNGKIIADGTPQNVGAILKSINHHMYDALPAPMRIYGAVENDTDCPINVREGRFWLEKYAQNHYVDNNLIPKTDNKNQSEEKIVELKDVWFRYEKNSPDVIKGLNTYINKGEFFAIVGGNGTGKTTALSLISGLNVPYRGEVLVKGEKISKIKNLYKGVLGVLPQNPQSLFVKNTVYLDLMEMLSDQKKSTNEKEEQIKKISVLCCIENLLLRHPYDLSGGEQQRAALAKVLLSSPQILLLDEPTKGMDTHFKKIFANILFQLKKSGVTVVMVSHDIEFCAEYADRCAMCFDGDFVSVAAPRDFFAGKSFYTTSANRMARDILCDAVLADDVIIACGGKTDKSLKNEKPVEFKICQAEDTNIKTANNSVKSRNKNKRTMVSALLALLTIPLTIYFGVHYFDGRKYYLISMLIILQTLALFFLSYEGRKPKAREVVIISVICSVAVAARTAFFMLPQFKPVVAIIIIAGVCFGGETGFLVGAVTGFVSNFFFGQGPWTPWQMFAFGIIGFIAGIIFSKDYHTKAKLSLTVYGFFAALIIYGGIMNPASVIMSQTSLNARMIVASFAAGLPFDLIHATSTLLFLWVVAEPMIDKLERIKIKYGIL